MRNKPEQFRRPAGPVIERARDQSGLGSSGFWKRVAYVLIGLAPFALLYGEPDWLFRAIGLQVHGDLKTSEQSAPPPAVLPPPAQKPPPSPVPPAPSRTELPRPASPPAPSAPTPAPAPSVAAAPPAPVIPAPPAVPPPAPPVARPAASPSILFARPPGATPAVAPFADTDVTQVVTRQVRRFNDSRDVVEKQDATRQILAAATIGHPQARSIIVSAFRTSTLVQGIAAPADVVRFALDFAIASPANASAARSFSAMAADLAARDPAAFAKALLDAMRDDGRLRDTKAARIVVDALSGSGAPCAALAAIAGHTGSGCDGGLAGALVAQAEARGAAGIEAASYSAAERAFARYLQEAL